MGCFKVHSTKNFTIINNCVFHDKTLSWKAKGILAQMLSLPEEWDYTEVGLAKLAKDGITSTRSALKELETAGYLVRSYIRESDGRVIDIVYDIYEVPTGADKTEPADAAMYSTDNKSVSINTNTAEEERTLDVFTEPESLISSVLPEAELPTLENPIPGEPILGFLKSDFLKSGFRTQSRTNIINNNSDKEQSSDDEPAGIDFDKWLSNINYESLVRDCSKSDTDEVLKIVRRLMNSKAEEIRIGNALYTNKQVKDKCKSLTYADLTKIINTVHDNSWRIKNRTPYIKAVIMSITDSNKRPVKCVRENKPRFEQRDYDYNSLEKALLAQNSRAEAADDPETALPVM